MLSDFSWLQLFATLWTVGLHSPGSFVHGDSPDKNTGVSCQALLQGIFPNQGLNQVLLYCRQILYQLSYRGSPWGRFSSVQSLSRVRLFATPWTAAHQASLSITNSRSSLKLMPIKSVMPSNQLILCHPLLLLPSIFPCVRVFPNESALCIKWPKYFSFSISPSSEYLGLIFV